MALCVKPKAHTHTHKHNTDILAGNHGFGAGVARQQQRLRAAKRDRKRRCARQRQWERLRAREREWERLRATERRGRMGGRRWQQVAGENGQIGGVASERREHGRQTLELLCLLAQLCIQRVLSARDGASASGKAGDDAGRSGRLH